METILAAHRKTSSRAAMSEDVACTLRANSNALLSNKILRREQVRGDRRVLEAHYAVWKVAGGDRSTDGGAAPCHSGGGHRTPVHRGIQRPHGAWHLRGHRLRRASLRVVRQV